MAKRIPTGWVALLRFELSHGDAKRIKGALQELSSLYRNGFILSFDEVNEFETTINGIVLRDGQDLKVVRWCLNALAQFGRLGSSRPYVELALEKYQHDPEIQAGGVAALCKMYRGSIADIEALQTIDPVIWKLAALQNTDPRKLDLGALNIDIYKAHPAILRLALITVGLNRDIENLFHPKHSNAAFVRHLGQHDDAIVQQYSVWSVIENRRLTFDDLGIPVERVESVPPNVQAKMYQLIAERDPDMKRRLDITARGSLIASEEARVGLAKGVREHYYDGLEQVTIEWFRQEHHKPVRELLAEHVGRYADACGPYEDLAFEIVEADETLKERLLLGAEGKPLYGKLKVTASRDLFDGLDNAYDLNRLIQNRNTSPNTTPTLKAMLLTASPLNQERVRIDQEVRDIRKGMQQITSPKTTIELDLHMAVRSSDIVPILLNSNAAIFHFSGHAFPDGLVFENALGESKSVDGILIVDMLSKLAPRLQCVILNACFTSTLAHTLSAYIPFVIACDREIDDDAAMIFSRTFYQALATGLDYRKSFDWAINDVKLHAAAGEAEKYVFLAHDGKGF